MIALARNFAQELDPMTQSKDELVNEWHQALGGELAQARKDAGISQGEMADRLGIGRTTLSKVERGLNPTLPLFLRYALELEVDFSLIAARARLIVKARALTPELEE